MKLSDVAKAKQLALELEDVQKTLALLKKYHGGDAYVQFDNIDGRMMMTGQVASELRTRVIRDYEDRNDKLVEKLKELGVTEN